MTEHYDCIVLGVGGFGSAALYHLARRGVRVLGLEQFDVAHDQGSSHGQTRIIRKAYFEHPNYVPLLVRSYELWSELEQSTGKQLQNLCGLFLVGDPEGEVIRGAKLSSQRYGVPLESVKAEESANRFPGFQFPDQHEVVFEPEAGYLHVEACVETYVQQAVAHGAEIRTGETVRNWHIEGDTVIVETDQGRYTAAQMVVTAGAWTSQLLADLPVELRVVRKSLYWHPVTSTIYNVSSGASAFYFETEDGDYYGFPSLDGKLLKIAEHTGGEPVDDPSALDQESSPRDEQRIRHFLQQALPDVSPEFQQHSVCMYTLTPDHHFIVDRHPAHPQLIIAGGFSGHGFKFTPVIGEALADMVLDGEPDSCLDFLSLKRLLPE